MQDLEQIQRANARATLPELSRLRGEGYHCVVEYQGANAVDVHGFKTEAEARAMQAAIQEQVGASAAYYAPLVNPLDVAQQQDDSLAAQAKGAQQATVTAVDAPADPGALQVRAVQVAALVLVMGNEVIPQPPQRVYAIVNEQGGIHALCGPDSEIQSARDAHVFAQAFALREALRSLLDLRDKVDPEGLFDGIEIVNARAVLDAATPVFAKFEMPSAEQQLAEARKNYDPSLNPSTASILEDDTRPSDVN